MLVEGAEFHEGVIPVEGNAGPALLADERLRVSGDELQQLDVSTVASSISAFQIFSVYPSVLRFSVSCSWRSGWNMRTGFFQPFT
jgi:hypothetical protein